jgi:TonB family protein
MIVHEPIKVHLNKSQSLMAVGLIALWGFTLSRCQRPNTTKPDNLVATEQQMDSTNPAIPQQLNTKHNIQFEYEGKSQDTVGSNLNNRSISGATPNGGWQSFRHYLRDQIRYPIQAFEDSIEGEVLLEFSINQEGRPIQIVVTNSLGYGCDKEAIRLLQNGPAWSLAVEATFNKQIVAIPFDID